MLCRREHSLPAVTGCHNTDNTLPIKSKSNDISLLAVDVWIEVQQVIDVVNKN